MNDLQFLYYVCDDNDDGVARGTANDELQLVTTPEKCHYLNLRSLYFFYYILGRKKRKYLNNTSLNSIYFGLYFSLCITFSASRL